VVERTAAVAITAVASVLWAVGFAWSWVTLGVLLTLALWVWFVPGVALLVLLAAELRPSPSDGDLLPAA
jgi:hypothetical protein